MGRGLRWEEGGPCLHLPCNFECANFRFSFVFSKGLISLYCPKGLKPANKGLILTPSTKYLW